MAINLVLQKQLITYHWCWKGRICCNNGSKWLWKDYSLNCISTIDKVTSGHIYVAGNDITKLRGNSLNKFRREELGFIFQDFNLLDTLTAYENIALALSIQNVNFREIDTRIKKVAKELDIVDVLNKYPYQWVEVKSKESLVQEQ